MEVIEEKWVVRDDQPSPSLRVGGVLSPAWVRGWLVASPPECGYIVPLDCFTRPVPAHRTRAIRMATIPAAFVDWFNQETDWLSCQAGMNPWSSGCEALMDEMSDWLLQDSSAVCEAVVTREDPRWAAFVARIWRCWSFHWRGSALGGPEPKFVSGKAVADALRNGRSLTNGGVLGGDPLRDVVWVEAMLQGDNRAIGLFYERFQVSAARWARAINVQLSSDLAWWQDTVAKLVGTSAETGKLASFHGRSALEPWLRTTLQRDLIRESSRRAVENTRLKDLGERASESSPETPAATAMSVECAELLSGALKSILGVAPRNERLTMRLMFVEKLGPQEIGKVLGIHKGNVTKTAQRFMKRVQAGLGIGESADQTAAERYGPCVEHMFDSREASDLGGLLSQVVSHLRESE